MFVDTQIISYAMKGCLAGSVEGCRISSIVANEFLAVYGPKPNQANYYIPHPAIISHMTQVSGLEHLSGITSRKKRNRPFPKHLTDSMIIGFGNDYPTIVEYGNYAISETINSGHYLLFSSAVNFMEKRRKKLLIDRFGFLLANHVECVPINEEDIGVAFELLGQFKEKHNLKANFRNSWNDILILATSRNRGGELLTKDTELSRFAAQKYGSISKHEDSFLKIQFSTKKILVPKKTNDNKGYVNSGWQVKFRKLRNQAFRQK